MRKADFKNVDMLQNAARKTAQATVSRLWKNL